MKNKIVIAAVVVIAVFLIGFIPQFVKVNRLEAELRKSQQENAGSQLRELISLTYFQATQKNFGLAAETSSQFFGRARDMTNQAQDATSRRALESLLGTRDKVTATLAKGDRQSRAWPRYTASSSDIRSCAFASIRAWR